MLKGQAAGLAAVAMLTAGACTASATTHASRVLVVDKAFDIKTADPHRDLSVTGAIVAKALYSTLLTFAGTDSSTPAPWVATSYTVSEDARRFVLKLRRDVLFSDGSPLTSADVVFSINRIISLKGPPSTLLAGVSASAPDASTVVLESKDPDPSLPLLLTTPSVGIVNSRVATADKGAEFLDNISAGSGPYVLKSFSTFSDVELKANPRYWGPRPFFGTVVIRNIDAPTQLAYMASASDQVALDLSPAQAGTLSRNPSVVVKAMPGSEVVYLFANENPDVSAVTSGKHFQNAVRYALDYDALVQLMGAGAVQAPGVIPRGLLGALPAWVAPHRDLDKARSELAASALKKPAVSLGFAGDTTVSGLPMSALATMVRAELGEAGIAVNLAARGTADLSAGTEQMGLWSFATTSSDPDQYLDFLPGRRLGLQAGWPAGADPALESFSAQAGTTADAAIRAQLFQEMQGQLNDDGPFFPLLQPGRVIVATRGITGLDFNPGWSLDVAAVSG